MLVLPGTPKAMVDTSAALVVALLALSAAITPRTSPVSKVSFAPLLCGLRTHRRTS